MNDMQGTMIRVTHCVNFPDLDGRTGIIQRTDHYESGPNEHVVRFSEAGGDWDWVKEGEFEVIGKQEAI